ncbi:MAG TPA: response regulator [Usitatibacter sp.]|nr:response regulator [Usitatibacter sp.]
MPEPILVCVVDDDVSVREALPDLLKELGFSVRTFSSAEAFLNSGVLQQTRCLILDIALPGISGPDLRDELARRKVDIPIVFITAHAEVLTRPDEIKGAAAGLVKPFTDAALLNALKTALRKT